EGETQSANFASMTELKQLVKMGGRLQWHTYSHPKLPEISHQPRLLHKELTVPASLKKLDPKGFKWCAYPHSLFDEATLTETKKHFKGAVSVIHGNDTDHFQLNRVTVTNESSFKKASIGVIIPSYNYGTFLVEAIESVLRQTRPVDEILISDDASTDNTQEIALEYVKAYPNLIKYNRNSKNLGVVAHFNKAVKLLNTDYICLLGADNRFRSDYIEKTSLLLDQDAHRGVAYTDFAWFGPKAAEMFSYVPPDRQGPIIHNHYFVVQFPEFTDKTKATLKKANFIHGSSLFRKDAWLEVGGYQQKATMAEDQHLFSRMIDRGWTAKRVPEPVLEYRQHSLEQVNTHMHSRAELHFYRTHYAQTVAELERVRASKVWKLFELYKHPRTVGKRYLKKLLFKVLRKLQVLDAE
ncbi:MAG TPA: glycosyltransferase, partial [Patescibacteria group bacterium]